MTFKINFLMWLMGLSIVLITGLMSAEYYTRYQALNNGLQQCLVTTVDGSQFVWAKTCKS